MTGKQLCALWLVSVLGCIAGAAVFGGYALYGDLVLDHGFARTAARLAAALGCCVAGLGINNTLGRAAVDALGREEAGRPPQD